MLAQLLCEFQARNPELHISLSVFDTQTVVERQLKREGMKKEDLGREEFEKRIWKWKAESGGRIAEQQRVLGSSPDWRRSKFTMDPSMNVAVKRSTTRSSTAPS